MAVITISHQLGSGGDEIARCVAERLGYECVGAEILAEAAHAHGLAEDRMTWLGEAKPAFLDRLGAEALMYIAVMQNAVLDAALRNDVVIIGRGGQWLLRDVAHVIRVRVMAPFHERARRLGGLVSPSVSGRGARGMGSHAIDQLLRRDDADKRGRMRYLYDCDLDDPLLYDLVIANSRGDFEGAAEAIALLARRLEPSAVTEGLQQLLDRAVAGGVQLALVTDERTRTYTHHEVTARHGFVHVRSRAPSAVVGAVAGEVKGVRAVKVVEVPAVSATFPLP